MLRFKILFLSLVIFAGIGWLAGFLGPSRYIATIEIMVDKGLLFEQLAGSYPSLREYIAHQKGIILSEGILNKITEELHLDISEEYVGEDIIKELRKQISVETIGESLIRIKVRTKDPHLSMRIATVAAEKYIETINVEKFFWAKKVKKWLEEGASLVKEINEKEAKLIKISQGRSFESLREEIKLTKKRIRELKKRRKSLENKIKSLKREEANIKRLYNQSVEYVLMKLENTRLTALRAQYRNIQKKIKALSNIYTPDHPGLAELIREKGFLDKNIKEALNTILEEHQAKISLEEDMLNSIEKDIEEESKKYATLMEDSQEIAGIQGEISFLKSKVEEIEHKLEEQGFFPINVSLMTLTPEAATPATEYKNYKTYLFIFSLMGFGVGIIISFIMGLHQRSKGVLSSSE